MSLIPEAEKAWHCIVVSNAMLQIFRTEAAELILGGKLILPVAVVTWLSHVVGSPEETMGECPRTYPFWCCMGWVILPICSLVSTRPTQLVSNMLLMLRICLNKQSAVWRFNEFQQTSSLSSLRQGFPQVKCVKTLPLLHGCNAIFEKFPKPS